MIWNELTISRKEISRDYLTQYCISNWVCFIFISSCTFWLISAHPYFVSFHTLDHYLKSSYIMSIRAPRLLYVWLHPQKPVYSTHLKIRSKLHVFDYSNRSTCNFWAKLQVRSAEKFGVIVRIAIDPSRAEKVFLSTNLWEVFFCEKRTHSVFLVASGQWRWVLQRSCSDCKWSCQVTLSKEKHYMFL